MHKAISDVAGSARTSVADGFSIDKVAGETIES
jgi:hypothetical protein